MPSGTLPDLITYGGVAASGTYTIAAGRRVDVGRVASRNVLVSLGVRAVNIYDNILSLPDILAATDLLSAALGARIGAVAQIRLSQDGASWGAWQAWAPATYTARVFDFRVTLTSADVQVTPVLTEFAVSVDVPDRVEDHVVSVPAGGLAIAYPGGAFSGCAAGSGVAPYPQVTITGAGAGDDALITGVTLSGFTVQIINAGAGVARATVAYRCQGY